MTLRELTTRLQTLCHDGWAEKTVGIKVLDAYYSIDDVQKISVGSEEAYFVIDTEVK